VELAWVRDEPSASDWIHGLLVHALGTLDLPVLSRLCESWRRSDAAGIRRWNDFLFASRGSRELQDEDRRMGGALARVLMTLGLPEAEPWASDPRTSHPTVFALAVTRWAIPVPAAASAFLFSWAENQAAAAMRLIPLGQSSGLRLVAGAAALIPAVVAAAAGLADDELGAGAPGAALASALHETQYSRLFRS
jgi:urease accessory protein